MEILQKIGHTSVQILLKRITETQEVVTSLALALFFYFNIFTIYLLIWFICGLLGTAVYKFLAGGPANPFGKEKIEQEMFWLITIMGPLGFVVACVSVLGRVLAKIRYNKFPTPLSSSGGSKTLEKKAAPMININDVRKFM